MSSLRSRVWFLPMASFVAGLIGIGLGVFFDGVWDLVAGLTLLGAPAAAGYWVAVDRRET